MSELHVPDNLVVRGEVRFFLWDRDLPEGLTEDTVAFGAFLDDRAFRKMRQELLLQEQTNQNLITNLGLQQFTSRIINGASTAQPGWIAFGTGTVTPAAAWTVTNWTAGAAEYFRKALSIQAIYQTYYLRYVVNSTTTDWNGTAKAVGLFDSATANAGNLFAAVSANQTKTSTQSLTTEWRILLKTI